MRFKRLSREELESYLASGEWRGKAGGYAVQGLAGTFVVKLVGSYTNVVGLPLYETVGLLTAEGYPRAFQLAVGQPRVERWPRRQSHPAAADAAPAPNAASRRRARPIRSARTRCKDVDLNRWLSGRYVIPVRDDEEPGSEGGSQDG